MWSMESFGLNMFNGLLSVFNNGESPLTFMQTVFRRPFVKLEVPGSQAQPAERPVEDESS